MNAGQIRLEEATQEKAPWRKWGPYLSERQWGTVREDYSEGGDAWNYFSHDQAHSRAYRWGDDGLAGFSDDRQRLCFALALWNGKDPILKERLFGLTNCEGNHGGRDLFARRKDGTEFQVEIGLNPIQTNEGMVVLTAIIDITERKRADEMLRQNEATLRASYSRIQDLAGRLITAQEAERSRIASDLHDDVNQQLAGLSIALSNVKRQLQNGGDATVQDEIRSFCTSAI